MLALQVLEQHAFEFSDWWQVAGVSKTLAQNWTNGRPLRISPSVMRADGKGTRNLYNIYDTYLLRFLSLLRGQGLSTKALKRVLEQLTPNFRGQRSALIQNFGEDEKWLVVSLTPLAVSTESVEHDPQTNNFVPSPLQLHELHDDIGIQVAVNLVKLRTEVNARAEKVLSQKRRSDG